MDGHRPPTGARRRRGLSCHPRDGAWSCLGCVPQPAPKKESSRREEGTESDARGYQSEARTRFFFAHLERVAVSAVPEDCSARLLALLERTRIEDAEQLLSKYYRPEERFRKGGVIDVVCCVVGCGATGRFKCLRAYKDIDPRILIHCRGCGDGKNWMMQQTDKSNPLAMKV